jgi:hypothetical protein
MKRKLYDLAHCRAGDKTDTTILSVIAYRPEDYALLESQVTIEALERHMTGIIHGDLKRFELPNLYALQFVGEQALDGGVTVSLGLDAHGKSLSAAVLELEIDDGVPASDAR